MAATVIAVLIGATALGLLIYGQHTSDRHNRNDEGDQ